MEATKVFTFFFLRGFQNYSVTSDRMNLGMVTPPGRETLVSLQRLLHHSREIFFVWAHRTHCGARRKHQLLCSSRCATWMPAAPCATRPSTGTLEEKGKQAPTWKPRGIPDMDVMNKPRASISSLAKKLSRTLNRQWTVPSTLAKSWREKKVVRLRVHHTAPRRVKPSYVHACLAKWVNNGRINNSGKLKVWGLPRQTFPL